MGRLVLFALLLFLVQSQAPQLSRIAFRHNALGPQIQRPREAAPTLFTPGATVDPPPAIAPHNELYMVASVTLLISGLVVVLLFLCHKLTMPKPNFH